MINQIKKNPRNRLAAGLVLALAALSGFAQEASRAQSSVARSSGPSSGPPIVVPARPGRIDAATVRVNRRAAIPFKSFADPSTGRGIDPGTGQAVPLNGRVTLPNGKTVTAKTYFDALDAAERKLNAQGHSLRGPERRVVIKELVTPLELLEKQKQGILAAYKKPSAGSTARLSVEQHLSKLQATANQDNHDVQMILGRRKGIPVIEAQTTLEKSYPWSWHYGNLWTFYAGAGGQIDVKSTTWSDGKTDFGTTNEVRAQIAASGSIFGVTQNMLYGGGSITTSPNGSTKLNLKFDVAGNTIYNNSKTIPAEHFHDSVWRDFDWSTTLANIDFGVATLDVTIGVKGTAAAEFGLMATPTGLYTGFDGYAQGHVYGSAALAAPGDIAEAGVNADMTLVFLKMDQHASVGLKADSGNQLCLRGNADVSGDVTALKGNIYAYVKAFGSEYDMALWDYPGIETSGTLLQDQIKKCIK